MLLPLLENATQDGELYRLTMAANAATVKAADHATADAAIVSPMPLRTPGPGEQYRFHFDMTKCVGCKCCVVACNEQNGNPAGIQWRRVGEIEGGFYPLAQRHYLSMGCNHCLEPSCLTGCPVDAYSKDVITGIVRHSADTCIGCQYCTWNCSYGVPQYNPERGVVGKCDMCYNRLDQGQQPACANACPTSAIQVEIVNVAKWREEYSDTANAPGMPSADDSLSSTRITQPHTLPRNIQKVDCERVRPEHAHAPLVIMTVLTQFSVGAFAAIAVLALSGMQGATRISTPVAAIVALGIAVIALGASTLHLGRPAYAWRALKMWRRSWLSREVLLFSIFAAVATACAAALWWQSRFAVALAILTVLTGAAGVAASARLYMVPGRPAWNTPHTFASFGLTAALLGSRFAALLTGGLYFARIAVIAAGTATLLEEVAKFFWLLRSNRFELQASARLLSTVLANLYVLRAILLLGSVLLAFGAVSLWHLGLALALAAGSELLGRYLFFVSVVPINIAAGYLSSREAA